MDWRLFIALTVLAIAGDLEKMKPEWDYLSTTASRDLSETKGTTRFLAPVVGKETVGIFNAINVELESFVVKIESLKQETNCHFYGQRGMGALEGEPSQTPKCKAVSGGVSK